MTKENSGAKESTAIPVEKLLTEKIVLHVSKKELAILRKLAEVHAEGSVENYVRSWMECGIESDLEAESAGAKKSV